MGPEQATGPAAQVQIRFINGDEHGGLEQMAPMLAPTNIGRTGLNEIVNHLLGATGDELKDYEFIVRPQLHGNEDKKHLLRSSLQKFIQQYNLSTETLLEIEYFQSASSPNESNPFPHEDWVAAIGTPCQKDIKNGCEWIVTGGFDGVVRVWTLSGSLVASFSHSSSTILPVKAVCMLPINDSSSHEFDGTFRILSGGMDKTLVCTSINTDTRQVTRLYTVAHPDTITEISLSSCGTRFVTSCYDNKLRLFTTSLDDLVATSNTSEEPSKKKRRLEKQSFTKPHIAAFDGHIGKISGVVFDDADTNTLYSSSWDTTIRIWKIDSNACDRILTFDTPITSLAITRINNSPLLIVGHSTGMIRVIDPNCENGSTSKQTFISPTPKHQRSHITDVAVVSSPKGNHYHFITTSLDGSIRLWDSRSSAPLYSLEKAGVDKKKWFACAWMKNRVLVGGEENNVRSWNVGLNRQE